MVIRQGDVLWVDFGTPIGSAPGFRRPAVVVQSNMFNESQLATLAVVALTTNLRRESTPGNVRLARGEGNLTRPSIAVVTQVHTIDRQQVIRKVGSISKSRVQDVVDGIAVMLGADRIR